MPDREKVIQALDDSLKNQHCGFVDGVGDVYAVSEETIKNIIALLKEQDERLRKMQKDKNKLCIEVSEWKHKYHDITLKEQEAENGEWITIWQEDDPDTSIHARCSICNRISERPLGGYCKWCGAKMNQEWGVDG